jgi:hypothetical protein
MSERNWWFDGDYSIWADSRGDGSLIGEITSSTDAEFIVKAVNNHDKLVETLEHLVWAFNNVVDDQIDNGDLRDALIEQCDKAQILLAETQK